MAWRSSVSLSRGLLNAAARSRPSTVTAAAFRRPTTTSSSFPRISFSNPRNLGVLACVQSLMPMHSVAGARLTSHIVVDARACCELSQGTFCRTCPDR